MSVSENRKIRKLIATCHELASVEPSVEFHGTRYTSEDSIREDNSLGMLTDAERDELIVELWNEDATNADAVTVITSVLNLLESPFK